MPYSQKVIDEVTSKPKTLGNQLGRWAIYYEIPVSKIAEALGITRQTAYNWFLGKDIFPAYRDRAEWMLKIFTSARNADDAWRTVCKELNLEP
jgi:hypothetical protein